MSAWLPHFLRHQRHRLAVLVTLAVAIVALTGVPGRASAASPSTSPLPNTRSVPGAAIVAEKWLSERTLQLTVQSPSFATPQEVEVMFPVGYATQTTRRWPVTYFLGGTENNQATFRASFKGEALTKSYPSIVVSPNGRSGYWSDHFNGGAGGPPMYETFVIEQLIPLIDANFRTIADRAHRAVLGGSMGGYGALALAARHPDVFTAASSLSGAVNTNYPLGAALVSVSPLLDVELPNSIYGPRSTEEARWRGHNPYDLAENLAGLELQLYRGNGIPSAAELSDPTDLVPAGCLVESQIIVPETNMLQAKLVRLGVPHVFTPLDYGCHTSEMCEDEISRTLPLFAARFAADVPAPASFDYRSIERRFSVYGWSVSADPARALEFIDLQDVSRTGFRITGSGVTKVQTPSEFSAGRGVIVTINGRRSTLIADTHGRVTVSVNLGPADHDQQYATGAVTRLRTAVVTLPHG